MVFNIEKLIYLKNLYANGGTLFFYANLNRIFEQEILLYSYRIWYNRPIIEAVNSFVKNMIEKVSRKGGSCAEIGIHFGVNCD